MNANHPISSDFILPLIGIHETDVVPVSLSKIEIPLKLVRSRKSNSPSLVIVDQIDEWHTLIRNLGERFVSFLRIAGVCVNGKSQLIIRPAHRRKILPDIHWPGTTYSSSTWNQNLFEPIGYTFHPTLKKWKWEEILQFSSDRLTWISTIDSQLLVQSIPNAAFRKPTLAVTIPKRAMCVVSNPASLFELQRFSVAKTVNESKGIKISDPKPPTRNLQVSEPEGWVGRIVKALRKKPEWDAGELTTESSRVDELLGTPESMVVGVTGAAHRAELESRVLHSLPSFDGASRAQLWAELADAYSVRRRPSDSALCWLNAIWDVPNPQMIWFDQWLREESFAARRPMKEFNIDRLLSKPLQIHHVRLVAVNFIRNVLRNHNLDECQSFAIPIINAISDLESELPIRLVWLARLAASKLVNGDVINLARARDAIVQRLSEHGPALDRDAPSFLRFSGQPEHHRESRDWVLRVRESARRWIRRVTGSGTLQWFGLDGESEATALYSDLYFAWAAARLGERSASMEWEMAASLALSKIGGPVHSALAAQFRNRIKESRDGTNPKNRIEIAEYGDDFAKFAVNKLLNQSSILLPFSRLTPENDQAAHEWTNRLPHLLRNSSTDEICRLVENAISIGNRFGTVTALAITVDFLMGVDAPPIPQLNMILDRKGILLFHAMVQAGFDSSILARRIATYSVANGESRSAILAAGWLSCGRDDRGMELLDACRNRLFDVKSMDARERTTLAIATAGALGLASHRVALGRLEELFHRLEGIDVTGSTNRFFTLKPLQIIETAIRSAVGNGSMPSAAVRSWLATDEQIILNRIARELKIEAS